MTGIMTRETKMTTQSGTVPFLRTTETKMLIGKETGIPKSIEFGTMIPIRSGTLRTRIGKAKS
jgi:hypothetical protein